MANNNSIWIDTTTFFSALGGRGARPTGIPRVIAECLVQAHQDAELTGRVRFCRASLAKLAIWEVEWQDIDQALSASGASELARPSLQDTIRRNFSPQMVDFLYRTKLGSSQYLSRVRKAFRRSGDSGGLLHPFATADVWINLGCWWHEDLPEMMARVKASGVSLHVATTIHDCIPLAFPEFYSKQEQVLWRDGLQTLSDTTDTVLAVSDNTARDVAKFIPPLADKVRVIRLGDVFNKPNHKADEGSVLKAVGVRKPYVLIVGTMEVRKNHVLAFRTWRTLINEGKSPPLLVFAGRRGWKVSDLLEEINDSKSLGGHLKVVESPSDDQLDALYRGALLTVFPSHYEGWGLPVRESLSYGKVCLAARNSAIPEAGDGLVDTFETNSQGDLIRLLETYMDGKKREEREATIRERFMPSSWDNTWHTIKASLPGMDVPRG